MPIIVKCGRRRLLRESSMFIPCLNKYCAVAATIPRPVLPDPRQHKAAHGVCSSPRLHPDSARIVRRLTGRPDDLVVGQADTGDD